MPIENKNLLELDSRFDRNLMVLHDGDPLELVRLVERHFRRFLDRLMRRRWSQSLIRYMCDR